MQLVFRRHIKRRKQINDEYNVDSVLDASEDFESAALWVEFESFDRELSLV